MCEKLLRGMVMIVIALLSLTFPVLGGTITIPGDVKRLCHYTDFFYNYPDGDFIYYLNDRLLFSEAPDERLVKNGLRHRITNIVLAHRLLKDWINTVNPGKDSVQFNLEKPEELVKTKFALKLLGLVLETAPQGHFVLTPDSAPEAVDYYKFALLDVQKLEKQLNATKRFYFKLLETDLPLPWTDQFIGGITGSTFDSLVLFENLVKYERLSLLLGVLYRLTDEEVRFIGNLGTGTFDTDSWKTIYDDKLFLMGLFVLSNGLRIRDGAFVMPGGKEAEDFWSRLAGHDCRQAPLEFLKAVATGYDGKLNLLYVFSLFQDDSLRKQLLLDYDASRMKEILLALQLDAPETINRDAFPRLRDFNFFTLLYSFREKKGRLYIPGGIESWLDALRGRPEAGDEVVDGPSLYRLYLELLLDSRQKMNSKKMTAIQKFMSLTTKFSGRDRLLEAGVVRRLYTEYEKNNVMVDFIEKIPVEKPATVIAMLDWIKRIEECGKWDRIVLTGTVQAMLEVLANLARFSAEGYYYDHLVGRLLEFPLSAVLLPDALLEFMTSELKVNPAANDLDGTLMQMLFKKLGAPVLNIADERYRFTVAAQYRKAVLDMIQSQDVSSLSSLRQLNTVLNNAINRQYASPLALQKSLLAASARLSAPLISDEAPAYVLDNMEAYKKQSLNTELLRLVNKVRQQAPQQELSKLVAGIKQRFLAPQLKDFMVALVYALNFKDAGLRVFLNPNLVHLHDFSYGGGDTPWNRSLGKRLMGNISAYHGEGGLSRLNVAFASAWQNQFFRRNMIYEPEHFQPLITNILEWYPAMPASGGNAEQVGFVEKGLAAMREGLANKETGKRVSCLLDTVATGYRRRTIAAFLEGRSDDHHLNFTELLLLGEKLSAPAMGDSNLDSRAGGLSAGIYYHSFGNLLPRRMRLFPQELGQFFDSGWISGEMIRELPVKAFYHAAKGNIPEALLGQLMYRYFFQVARRFYHQNYYKDYVGTYFMLDVCNRSHLVQGVNKMKKEGYLRML